MQFNKPRSCSGVGINSDPINVADLILNARGRSVSDQDVRFKSGQLSLAGAIRRPAGLKSSERRPAFIVLHGFGSTMESDNARVPCSRLSALGYVTMRFDMRGCGRSEGEKGRVICLEQVADTCAAVSFMASQANVDPQRIAVLGSSFGAAVAVYSAGVDDRIAAVISSGGWGNGETKFRGQHSTPDAWAKFVAMLEAGRSHKQRTGDSLMVPRYDIVPIPEHMRTHVAPGSIQMFPAETAQSMYDFKAEAVISKIAPRPVLLLHSAKDSVTPTQQSIDLFNHAGQPCDLHLFSETDHFMFADTNVRVWTVIEDWLAKYFPVSA
jgi:alpha-beta hydrolase superfamily lysophospholipase